MKIKHMLILLTAVSSTVAAADDAFIAFEQATQERVEQAQKAVHETVEATQTKMAEVAQVLDQKLQEGSQKIKAGFAEVTDKVAAVVSEQVDATKAHVKAGMDTAQRTAGRTVSGALSSLAQKAQELAGKVDPEKNKQAQESTATQTAELQSATQEGSPGKPNLVGQTKAPQAQIKSGAVVEPSSSTPVAEGGTIAAPWLLTDVVYSYPYAVACGAAVVALVGYFGYKYYKKVNQKRALEDSFIE